MTKEDALQRLEIWLHCRRCPAEKRCYNEETGETCKYFDCKNKYEFVDAIKILVNEQAGVWIDEDGDNATCSCCNRYNFVYGSYCKHCGAKMKTFGGVK